MVERPSCGTKKWTEKGITPLRHGFRLGAQGEEDHCRVSQIPLAVLSIPSEVFFTRALALAGHSILKGPE